MLKIITSILLTAINRLIDSDVRKEIRELVQAYMNVDNLSGPEKKERVKQELSDLKGELGKNIQEMQGFVLSTAIDIYHAWLAARSG